MTADDQRGAARATREERDSRGDAGATRSHAGASLDGRVLRFVASYENVLPLPQADGEVFVNTAAALARRGHEVELLAPAVRGRAAPPSEQILAYYGTHGPLRIRELPSTNASLAVQMVVHAQRVVRDAAARRADFVYARNPVTVAFALAAGHRVFYDHYRPWGDQVPPMRPLLRHMLTHPNLLGGVTHSAYALESYHRLGIPEERLRVAHNGFEPTRMEPRLDRDAARRKLGLPVEGAIVTYAGRVDDSKGLDVVLDVAERLPSVTFLLVGARGESEIRRRAHGRDNVEVIDWQPPGAIPAYLYAADVLIVPPSAAPLSQQGHTVLPLKLFLYLAGGRPILGPANPDVAEVLTDGEESRLVPAGDVDEATRSLRTLLADPERCARMGARALEKADALTWDARAERIVSFLLPRLEAHERAGGRKLSPTVPLPVGKLVRDTVRWSLGVPRGRLVLSD